MLTCSRIVDEFTTNSLLSLSVTILTRAQQLLRWATGWPQRHGPKSGGGAAVPLFCGRAGSPSIQCRLSRSLPEYQATS